MSRLSTTGAIILTLALVSACDDDEPLGVSHGISEVQLQASVTGSARDVEAMQQIVATFDQAWGNDPVTYAAQYANVVDWVGPNGLVLSDAAAITGLYTAIFNGFAAGTTRTSTIRNLFFLTGTIAILDIDTRVTGFTSPPPGVVPWQPGVIRALERNVLIKRGGEWRIVYHQQTLVAPGV